MVAKGLFAPPIATFKPFSSFAVPIKKFALFTIATLSCDIGASLFLDNPSLTVSAEPCIVGTQTPFLV